MRRHLKDFAPYPASVSNRQNHSYNNDDEARAKKTNTEQQFNLIISYYFTLFIVCVKIKKKYDVVFFVVGFFFIYNTYRLLYYVMVLHEGIPRRIDAVNDPEVAVPCKLFREMRLFKTRFIMRTLRFRIKT